MGMAMAMAFFMILALGARSDDDSETQLLNEINQYRSTLGVSLLSYNKGASCLADKLVDRYENQPCNNITQAQTTADGLEPNFPEYPKMLRDCNLQLQNTTAGQILVDCVPPTLLSSARPGTAAQNFTKSQQFQSFINSSDFISAGVASEDLWFVLVLATGQNDGNFAESTSGGLSVVASGPLFSFSLLFALLVYWALAETSSS